MLMNKSAFREVSKRLRAEERPLQDKAFEIAEFVLVDGNAASQAAIKFDVTKQRVSNVLKRFTDELNTDPKSKLEAQLRSVLRNASPKWRADIQKHLKPLGLFTET